MSAERRIHVLHVIKGLGRGGAEKLLEHAQRHVDRDRFRLSYAYFLERKSELAGRLRDLGGEVTLVRAAGPLGMALSVGRLARLMDQGSVDLVHAHLPLSAAVARLAARRAGVPLVYTEHNLQERHHPWSRLATRSTWDLQRQVVAVSEAVASSLRRNLGDGVPIRVIPNGVPVDELVRDVEAGGRFRARLGLPAGTPLIGQIAVFRPEKRLDLWLETAAALRREIPECRFVLVGDGPERRRLEARAAALSLADAVHFTGLLEDVRPALSALDLMLITSRFEGLPLVLLEAMAAGVPVVATAAGGIPEVVGDGSTGRLVGDPDPSRLAAAAAELLSAPEVRLAMARAAADTVRARFSAEAMQQRLEELYLEVLTA